MRSRRGARGPFRCLDVALVVTALAALLLAGCKKKPPPAPVADPAKLEARIGELEDGVRALSEANRDLALRVDSLEALQSRAAVPATRGRSGSRRGRASDGGAVGAAGPARSAGDSLAIDLDRQKMIFSNYEMLEQQGFQGDTIPSFLSRKYGVDTSAVGAIARRGRQEGW